MLYPSHTVSPQFTAPAIANMHTADILQPIRFIQASIPILAGPNILQGTAIKKKQKTESQRKKSQTTIM